MTPNKVGRYAIVGAVSRGPDEDVLVGEQGSRRVTIRLIHGQDREGVLDDARRAAALAHANVAHQEVGLHEDEPFLAAEIVGESLTSWAARESGMAERLRVVEGVSAGLAHAHAHGVVHGRLTPQRIAVGPDGVARIWGFGVRGLSPEKADAPYQAPEVADGFAATTLADVYSAGVVFYELLAGEAPLGEAPAPLRELRKDLPKDLADAIMACRERSIDWRPKDLDYLLELLLRTRSTRPAAAKPQPARLATDATPRPSRPEARHAGPPILPIAIGLVVFLGGATALYLRSGSAAPPAAAPATPAPTPPAASQPASAPPATTMLSVATPKTLPTPRSSPSALAPSTTARSAPPAALATPEPTPVPSVPTALAAEPTPPPVTTVSAPPPSSFSGPAQLRGVSPPLLRRGQRTLLDVHGEGLYPGLAVATLRGGRPAEGLRPREQRFVNASLLRVFIEVDANAPAGAYLLLLSDGQNVTNAVRFEVAK